MILRTLIRAQAPKIALRRVFRTPNRALRTVRRYSTADAPSMASSTPQSQASMLATITTDLDKIAPRFELQPDQITIIQTPAEFYETLKVGCQSFKLSFDVLHAFPLSSLRDGQPFHICPLFQQHSSISALYVLWKPYYCPTFTSGPCMITYGKDINSCTPNPPSGSHPFRNSPVYVLTSPGQNLKSQTPNLPQYPLHRQDRARTHLHNPHRAPRKPHPPCLLPYRLSPRDSRNPRAILRIPTDSLDHRIRLRKSRSPHVPHAQLDRSAQEVHPEAHQRRLGSPAHEAVRR
jgi:hypothetical protein